ncbi:MAG: alpha/beta fold hydrolase [Stellaceae bacterium]
MVLLHGSAGSGAMWRRVADALQPLYRTVAPDLIGYGAAPPWPAGAPLDLAAEARALDALLPCCGEKYHLVGYSYGGAVALHMALANPARVRTLTLIEPVFFAALRYAHETAAYDRLCRVRDEFVAGLAEGARESAMRRFIDFWTGDGAWAALAPALRAGMLQSTDKIVLDWQASFATDPGPQPLARLGARTALLRGERSPAPMRRLVDALHRLMPGSRRTVVAGANHLLPLTHSAAMIEAIMEQLSADADRRLR